jgi:hypothetical protein
MLHNTLSIPSSKDLPGRAPAAPTTNSIPKKQRRIWALPGLTGPVILVAPRANPARKTSVTWDILSLATDILELRAWREMDPIGCFMLAAFTAVVTQPLVFGDLGSSIVALMTPLK